MIRVVIVDDHTIVRRGLLGILAKAPDLSVVGEAGGIGQAKQVITAQLPDVVCCDLKLQDGDGSSLVAWIRDRTGANALVLTTYDEPALVRSALGAGARGYLLKDVEESLLFDAIRRVASGQTYYATALSTRISYDLAHDALLTQRELEVIKLAAAGATNTGIGQALGIGEPTVKTYFTRIFAKLGVSSRTQAVVAAIDRGYLDRSALYHS
ncbi:response regulator transcription factor [Ferrimicrobium sp.]|jgi:DNA-binding NarL/FixJ family response regulator|uniref:Response regulator n=1 Tax=Ferrimicrobium acidiphilum TaxID=121039 RepID=A0ABV3Y355_9ACTN|nr:response regulator transcription factor [Ferrimicrobium sp.]MCL5973671.1 response regulator transcription factor [Actinomycetota bacterium]